MAREREVRARRAESRDSQERRIREKKEKIENKNKRVRYYILPTVFDSKYFPLNLRQLTMIR